MRREDNRASGAFWIKSCIEQVNESTIAMAQQPQAIGHCTNTQGFELSGKHLPGLAMPKLQPFNFPTA